MATEAYNASNDDAYTCYHYCLKGKRIFRPENCRFFVRIYTHIVYSTDIVLININAMKRANDITKSVIVFSSMYGLSSLHQPIIVKGLKVKKKS